MRQVCLAQEIRDHCDPLLVSQHADVDRSNGQIRHQLLERLGNDPGIHRLNPPHSLRGLDG